MSHLQLSRQNCPFSMQPCSKYSGGQISCANFPLTSALLTVCILFQKTTVMWHTPAVHNVIHEQQRRALWGTVFESYCSWHSGNLTSMSKWWWDFSVKVVHILRLPDIIQCYKQFHSLFCAMTCLVCTVVVSVLAVCRLFAWVFMRGQGHNDDNSDLSKVCNGSHQPHVRQGTQIKYLNQKMAPPCGAIILHHRKPLLEIPSQWKSPS